MKLWQLVSIVNGDRGLVSRVAKSHLSWSRYELFMREFSDLVDAQNREVLDSLVETDFANAVLGSMKKNLYLSSDNWLRSWQAYPTDQTISMLDSFSRYGADVVEDVCESGSVKVN